MAAAEPVASLADELRAATRQVHLEVERGPFMGQLLRGQVSRAGYGRLLRGLFELYRALEAELTRARAAPVVAAIFEPALFRAERLAADLEALHGPGWRAEVPVPVAALAYAQHLQQLGQTAPALLAAHVYVRSLGDLSGGQLVRGKVAEALALGPEALTFYDFGAPERVRALASALRGALAALPLTPAERPAFLEEAQAGFARHRDLFAELAQAADR